MVVGARRRGPKLIVRPVDVLSVSVRNGTVDCPPHPDLTPFIRRETFKRYDVGPGTFLGSYVLEVEEWKVESLFIPDTLNRSPPRIQVLRVDPRVRPARW